MKLRRLALHGLIGAGLLIKGGTVMAEVGTNQFQIRVMDGHSIATLPSDYNHPQWKQLLKKPPTGEVIVSDEDIESYRWADQQIVLTPAASERLNKRDLINTPFVAWLGTKAVFAGAVIEPGSARAINYPVFYITKNQM